mgnify:CR=1 FL=1
MATTYFQIVAVRERRALADESLSNAQGILDLLLARQSAARVGSWRVNAARVRMPLWSASAGALSSNQH